MAAGIFHHVKKIELSLSSYHDPPEVQAYVTLEGGNVFSLFLPDSGIINISELEASGRVTLTWRETRQSEVRDEFILVPSGNSIRLINKLKPGIL
jgi:hypothetical protein